MTTIIAFVSQKGGVGKSTLSRALAREAANSGLKVKVADLDTQQGTTTDWNRRRLDAGFEPHIAVEAFATAAQALQIASQYDLLIIVLTRLLTPGGARPGTAVPMQSGTCPQPRASVPLCRRPAGVPLCRHRHHLGVAKQYKILYI
jgi:AAA domain